MGFEIIITTWLGNLGLESCSSISSMKMSVNTDQKSKQKFWIVKDGIEGIKMKYCYVPWTQGIPASCRPGFPISERIW